MNERIKLLAREAEMAANKGDHVDVKIMMAKFAELLIRECCEQVEQAKHSPFVSLDDAKRMQHFVNVTKKKINKHFGVEE